VEVSDGASEDLQEITTTATWRRELRQQAPASPVGVSRHVSKSRGSAFNSWIEGCPFPIRILATGRHVRDNGVSTAIPAALIGRNPGRNLDPRISGPKIGLREGECERWHWCSWAER
jgi:hypothetical protein